MKQRLLEHPHAVASWQTIRVGRDGTLNNTVVVETDLMLNAQHEDYDKDAVDSLLDAVRKFIETNKYVDVVEVEPLLVDDEVTTINA
jgi:hypothetical protein